MLQCHKDSGLGLGRTPCRKSTRLDTHEIETPEPDSVDRHVGVATDAAERFGRPGPDRAQEPELQSIPRRGPGRLRPRGHLPGTDHRGHPYRRLLLRDLQPRRSRPGGRAAQQRRHHPRRGTRDAWVPGPDPLRLAALPAAHRGLVLVHEAQRRGWRWRGRRHLQLRQEPRTPACGGGREGHPQGRGRGRRGQGRGRRAGGVPTQPEAIP